MKITISGLCGSGTTTVASLLSKKLNMELISSGIAFRELARERGLSLEEFGKLSESDSTFDNLIDQKQKEMALDRDNIIAEGRLSGFMVEAGLKIWLKAPLEVRSKRVAKRENKPTDQALAEITKREECDLKRYEKYYQIDLNDLSIYDLIIDSSKWLPESIADIIMSALEK